MSASDTIDTLNLASNEITDIPANCFHDLKVLNSLDLEGNSLKSLHPHAFAGIEDTLEWLKLGDNLLSSIPNAALKKLSLLLQLDLRGNNISVIKSQDFFPYGHHIKFVYLQKNR